MENNINDLYGKQINTKPRPETNIGVDLSDTFLTALAYSGESSQVDISKLESFRQASQSREQVYDLIDTMVNDSTMASVLETYAEDSTETNENGDILWVESDVPEVGKYIKFLLDSMDINKHIYKWVYSLCKYGDCYLRLYRDSDFQNFQDFLLQESEEKKNLNEKFQQLKSEDKVPLQEDVIVKGYSKTDRYAHYVEMVPNPAEMFELTKFGKSYAYIKAPVNIGLNRANQDQMYPSVYKFLYRMKDVQVYEPTEFVHACLDDGDTRYPEEVSLFLTDDITTDSDSALNFNVRRGQSIFYNSFKIWRELSLLENSLLLNRITKSSILRVIGVEVGDMPKENIQKHLMGIKQLIEQKSAVNTGNSLSEYTNPGPMENNIYIPTHNGQGTLTTQQIGGDVDVRGISDIDYFRDKLFGNLRIPKQYFGFTEDGAGFNGGQSLTILSSRYAKTIKRIQNTMIQAITDIINLMLLDKGMDSYINRYTLKMQPPTTQEEMDRRDNLANKIAVVGDIMNLLAEMEDASVKLKILKSLLKNVVSDPEVMNLIQDQIDQLESLEEEGMDTTEFNNGEDNPMLGGGHSGMGMMEPSMDMDFDMGGEEGSAPEPESGGSESSNLPTPEELGGDFTDANLEI